MAFYPDKPADSDKIRLGAKQIRDNFNGIISDGIVIPKPPLYGEGAPSATRGQARELYIDTKTGDQYLKNISGKWELKLSLEMKADKTRLKALETVMSTDKTKLEALETVMATLFPVGTVFEFAAETPPKGALVGNGALLPIADYPKLFNVIGYKHTPVSLTPPAGCFYLPNYMDYFLRGHNPSSGRKFGSEQKDAIRNITGTLSTAGFDSKTKFRAPVIAGGAFTGSKDATLTTVYISSGINTAVSNILPNNTAVLDVSNVVPTADENRPVNKTVLICIKY